MDAEINFPVTNRLLLRWIRQRYKFLWFQLHNSLDGIWYIYWSFIFSHLLLRGTKEATSNRLLHTGPVLRGRGCRSSRDGHKPLLHGLGVLQVTCANVLQETQIPQNPGATKWVFFVVWCCILQASYKFKVNNFKFPRTENDAFYIHFFLN